MESAIIKDNNKYQFDIKDYKIVHYIGSGNLSKINLVQNIRNNCIYAAKTNHISNLNQNKLLLSRQIRILFQIQHPTLIRYRGISFLDFDEQNNITFLIDYMKEGSLAKIIDDEQSYPNYNNTKKQIILAGVARGMMIIHDHHIIQRYLKPENILLDSHCHPQITDFGIYKIFDPCNSMIKSPSNSIYMAPEVTRGGNFTTKSDVYSFGIVMYEIILGKRASKFNLISGLDIEFVLENPVLISGLDIYAANSHFPQSFDVEIDGKSIIRIKIVKC